MCVVDPSNYRGSVVKGHGTWSNNKEFYADIRIKHVHEFVLVGLRLQQKNGRSVSF